MEPVFSALAYEAYTTIFVSVTNPALPGISNLTAEVGCSEPLTVRRRQFYLSGQQYRDISQIIMGRA
jgi:hypothetical protein